MNKNKKAIIVAGQSNTHTSHEFGMSPVMTGSLDISIKYIGRDVSNHVPVPAGVSNIQFQDGAVSGTSYGYPLAKKNKDTLACGELLIIPCAVGGTGWSTGHWAASGALYKDLIARVRYAIEILHCEIVGFFWSQGEADCDTVFAPIYSHLLDGLAMTIRDVAEAAGQASARTIPFVTFDMVTEWVGSNEQRQQVQEALTEVGDRIPFASNIDTTDLPANLDTDTIHYDTRQIMEIGNRMYEAWQVARRKNNDVLPAKGTYLLHTLTVDNYYTNKWEGLYFGEDETADKYSRLGEVWKYRQHRKYRFKLEFDLANEGGTHRLTFEQAFIPFMFEAVDSPASLLAMTDNLQLGNVSSSYFQGLHFTTASQALVELSRPGGNFFVPAGLTVAWNGGIPVAEKTDAKVVANQLRIYALVS